MHLSNLTNKFIHIIDKLVLKHPSIIEFDEYLLENEKFSHSMNSYYSHNHNCYKYSLKIIKNYFKFDKYNNPILHNKCLNEVKLVKNHKNNDEYLNYILSSKYINKLKYKILDDIDKKYIINYDHFENLNNIKIQIYSNKNISKKHINKLIYNLTLLFHMILSMYSIKNRKLNLAIFYCDFKKEYYKNSNIIDYGNMNSGLSYNNNIVLFRKEEIIKVFIHELLHFIGIDNDYNNKENNSKKLSQIFKINSDHNYNEAYIEFNAIIIHLCYLSFYFENNIILSKHLFKIFINYEILFSLFQLSKFLNNYNYRCIDFFKQNNYVETTNTFSYIYLKFIYLFNYSRFINLSIHNNIIIPFNENLTIKYIEYLNSKNLINNLDILVENVKIVTKNYCINNIFSKNNHFCINNRLSLFEFSL